MVAATLAHAPDSAEAVTCYFSDFQAGTALGCLPGNNACPGTLAAPKQDLAGINVNALPEGSLLLFNRGRLELGVNRSV